MVDYREAMEFARHLAWHTGRQLLKAFGEIKATHKADGTLVTQADVDADRIIARMLRGRYPDHGIVSEELSTVYRGESYVWVVDPLDGTANFSWGLPIWSVAIALLHRGYPVVGVVHLPVLRQTFYAARGEGAFLEGRPLRLNPPTAFTADHLYTACTRTMRRYRFRVAAKPRILGSAAYNLALVAQGVAVAGMELTPKVWDVAASWVLVEEAGGVIGCPDGESHFPLHPGVDLNARPVTTAAAVSPALYETFIASRQRL